VTGLFISASGSVDDNEKSAALLSNFESDLEEEDSEVGDVSSNRDQDALSSNDGGGSRGGGGGGGDDSGHVYQHIMRASESSTGSYETTSSSHTAHRNTASTAEFSTSYRPYFSHEKHHHMGTLRPSETSGYMSGSVIVNALMWPIGHTNSGKVQAVSPIQQQLEGQEQHQQVKGEEEKNALIDPARAPAEPSLEPGQAER
jgi:hypothetical protein